MDDLEKLYSPSKWAKCPETVITNHVTFVTNESLRIKQSVPCQIDIPYGDLENEKFDIFGTDLADDSAVFIYIHGGYWQDLHRNISSYVVAPLYKNKIKTIVLGYTLCPTATLGEIINEVKSGFTKCLEYIKTARKIALGGHSAGAHLSISLFQKLTEKAPPAKTLLIQDLFLISGVYNLTPLVRTSVNAPLGLDEDSAKKYSPQLNDLKAGNALLKVHIIVGEHDSPAFKTHAEQLHNKVKDANIRAEFVLVKTQDHFSIVEKLSEDDYELTKSVVGALNS